MSRKANSINSIGFFNWYYITYKLAQLHKMFKNHYFCRSFQKNKVSLQTVKNFQNEHTIIV